MYNLCLFCTVHSDTVGSGARLRAAGRGDCRHGAATQAGAQHPDVNGESGSATTQRRRRRPDRAVTVAFTRQAQTGRRHTGIDARFDGTRHS